MNNWETCLHPTYPWRSAMSIPRSLSLRRTANGLRLVQTPLRELQSLRGEPVRIVDRRLPVGETSLAEDGIDGDRLEILAEFSLGEATEVGLNVRVGAEERTVVGYEAQQRQVFVDRSRSGEAGFHPRFAGRHAGPVDVADGRIRLHLFVDASSVEVFADDGATVLTECLFPAPSSRGVSVYTNGPGTIVSVQAWPLKSIWFPDPRGDPQTPP
jgi:fructan beta-fructosidase